MNAEKIETWVDQTIQQAQRRGDFDNLPGAGRPLSEVDPGGDPDWWVKGLIEREKLDMSAAMPTSMSLRRERERLPGVIAAWSDEARVRAHLQDFNERVLAERRRPWDGPGSPPIVGRIDVEDSVQAWRESRLAHHDVSPDARTDARTETSGAATQGTKPETAGAGESNPRPRRRWWRRTGR